MPTTHASRHAPAKPVVPEPIDTQGIALAVIAALAAVFLLRYTADVLVPLVLAIFASYALDPLVNRVVAWRLPRPLAAGAVLVGLVVGLAAAGWALSDQVLTLANGVPAAAEKLRQTFGRGPDGAIARVQKAATEIEKSAEAAAPAAPPPRGVTRVEVAEKPIDVRGYLWTGSMGLLGLASQGVLLLFLVFFVLCSGDLYQRKIVHIVGPPLSRQRVTIEVLDEINAQVQQFLLVQLVTCAAVGLVSWIAFRLIGLHQAGLWGLLAGLFNSIPYFGPFLVTAAIAVAALVQFGSFTMVAAVAALALAITSLEGFLVTPWIVGRSARMNEVAVFVGLLFWAWTWGVTGMLLAVPMLVVVKAVADHVEELRPLSELLAD
jgi:predicted PurR-regulated permease PerM